MNNITCPHCGRVVELTEAIIHQLVQQVRAEEEEKRKIELEKARAEMQAKTEKRLKEEFEEKNKKSQIELDKASKQMAMLKAEFKKKQEAMEKKTWEEASKKAQEEERLKLKEKDLQLEEIRRVNEDLKRKLEQGSQQRQGEVLELDLEEKLKATFPTDEFLPIPKGVEGGDIWQKIIYQGRSVGSILWETKRTKAWSNGWTRKLKDDAAKISASEAIIASTVLPQNGPSFDRKDGVWITTYEHALSICRFVRFLVTTVSSVKSSASQTEEEWGMIRDYIMSDSFKHRMQAHFDGIKALRDTLDGEKRATMLRWKRQENIIDKLDANNTSFYGEIKAIVSNLPEVKGLDSPLLEEGNEESKETLL